MRTSTGAPAPYLMAFEHRLVSTSSIRTASHLPTIGVAQSTLICPGGHSPPPLGRSRRSLPSRRDRPPPATGQLAVVNPRGIEERSDQAREPSGWRLGNVGYASSSPRDRACSSRSDRDASSICRARVARGVRSSCETIESRITQAHCLLVLAKQLPLLLRRLLRGDVQHEADGVARTDRERPCRR